MNKPVLIIGAGAAGLAAADALAQEGVAAELLEAQNRIGGRILTVQTPAIELPVELGAEFIHGRPPATWEWIDRAGLLAYDVPFDHMQRRHGRLVQTPGYEKGLDKIMAGLARVGRRDMSFLDYLRSRPGGTRSSAARAALDFVRGFDAADPQEISARSLAEEHEQAGAMDQTQFRLLGGYGPLMEFLRRRIERRGVRLHLGCAISDITWKSGDVTAHAAEPKKVFHGARAIITLPVGVLAESPGRPGAVRLIPDPPALRRALGRIAFGPVVKVILVFRERFWESPAFARRAHAAQQLADASFLHAPGAPIPVWWTARPLRVAILTGWAGGPDARALAKTPRGQLRRIALQSLGQLFAMNPATLDARLADFLHHDWINDSHARGAYSYLRVNGMRARARLAEPIEQTLFFAGEAADISGQASTVAGALASGAHAAQQVLATL